MIFTPLPHQERAINAILERPALYVAYGTGTGKFGIMVTAAEALYYAFGGQVLILSPNSILDQQVRDMDDWIPDTWRDSGRVLGGSLTLRDRAEALRTPFSGITLLSHEGMGGSVLGPDEERESPVAMALAGLRPTAVLVDEASRFRNNSKRTNSLISLGGRTARRYMFSGTQVVKNPLDVWWPMKFINLGWCRGPDGRPITRKTDFLAQYCVMDPAAWKPTPLPQVRPETKAELLRNLDAWRITCQLSDVRGLPERIVKVRTVPLSPEQARAYATLRDTLALEIARESAESFRTQVRTYATRMLRLLELAAGFARNADHEWVPFKTSAKTRELVELLEGDASPTVVWTLWRPEQELVCLALQRAGLRYTLSYQDFQDPNGSPILVQQIAAGGVGLNLQRASRMIYHSLSWDAELMSQSLDRNMRLSTVHPSLAVDYIVADRTLDQYVLDKLGGKADLAKTMTRTDALAMLRVRNE